MFLSVYIAYNKNILRKLLLVSKARYNFNQGDTGGPRPIHYGAEGFE